MKAIVAALALLAYSAAFAQPAKKFPWDQRPNKCFLPGGDVPPALNPMCAANDWPSLPETKHRIDILFAHQDLDWLERAEEEVGFSRERFASGEYRFEAWFLSLDANFRHLDERSKAFALRWAKEKGAAGYAPLVQAMVAHAEAWEARGTGYADTVSPEARQIYLRKLEEADALLETASPKLRQMPPWTMVKLRIAFQHRQAATPSPIEILKRGTEAFPDFLPVYTAAMSYLSPKWGGSFEMMDAIARYAMERNANDPGIYALVYERNVRVNPDSTYTLRDTAVDWELMKTGFRRVHGKPAWIFRNFAGLACQMRDRNEARRLYELYDKADQSAKPSPLDHCRVFAMSPQ